VFIGREVFVTDDMPVTLELPVAYVPRVAQAPPDPLFVDLGLEPDAAYRAVYVVPRLTAVYPAYRTWHVVASMGAGIAWYTTRSGRRDREVGYPLTIAVGAGVRLGGRWSVRVTCGGYADIGVRDRSVYTLTAGLVRHF
jgi:hypothetical protein